MDNRIPRTTMHQIHHNYFLANKHFQEQQQRIPPVSTMLKPDNVPAVRPTMLPSQEKLAFEQSFISKSEDEERRYQCTQCEKRFRQMGHLQQHIRIHTNDRPYQCAHCDKAFKQKSQVNQHERIHTGEKPYQCNICYRAFPQQGQLYSHKKSSHGLDARVKMQNLAVQEHHQKLKKSRKKRRSKKDLIDVNSLVGKSEESGPLPVFVYVLDPNAAQKNDSNMISVSNVNHKLSTESLSSVNNRVNLMGHHPNVIPHSIS